MNGFPIGTLTTTVLVLAAAACTSVVEQQACDPPAMDLVPTIGRSLDSVPADSVVTAMIRWVANGPADPVAWLEAHGAQVLHRFHYQPWILFAMKAGPLRELAASPDVIVEVDYSRVDGAVFRCP
jgi:hypothetical protein